MVPLVPAAPLPTSWPAKTAGLVVLVQQVLAAVVRILSVVILDALCCRAGGQMEFLGAGVQDVGGRCGNRRAGLPSGSLLPCRCLGNRPGGILRRAFSGGSSALFSTSLTSFRLFQSFISIRKLFTICKLKTVTTYSTDNSSIHLISAIFTQPSFF